MMGVRRGFTLVETLLAVSVALIALASVGVAFIGGGRLMAAAFAESELALASRELRDKLLFHAAPPDEDTVWSGLLASTNRTFAAVSRTRLRFGSSALRENFLPVAQTIDLKLTDGKIEIPGGPGAARTARWFAPNALDYRIEPDQTATNAIRLVLTGRIAVSGLNVEHRERIDIPLRR